MLCLMLAMNINSWWWMWIVLEMLNWIFILYIKSPFFILFFLIWQSLSSLFILYSLLFLKYYLMIGFMFLCKMALPPFHMMFWNVHFSWSIKSFFMFLCVHKYPNVLILSNFISLSTYYWLLSYPLILLFSFYNSTNFKSVMWIILMSDSLWMFLSMMMNMNIFLFYLVYNLILMFLLMFLSKFSSSFWFLFKDNFMLMTLLLMTNIPPMVSFLLKWLIISMNNWWISFLTMLFSVALIFILWNFIYYMTVFLNKSKWNSKMFMNMFMLMHFMWFFFV